MKPPALAYHFPKRRYHATKELEIDYIGPITLDFVEENRAFAHLEILRTEAERLGKYAILDSALNMPTCLKI